MSEEKKRKNEIAMKSYWKHRESRLARNRERAFKYWLKKAHGITHEEYLVILESQEGKCKICGCLGFEKTWTSKKLPFVVDHCHSTGKIRGLLCDNCNVLIGHAKDDVNILQSAIKYVKENE